MLTELAVTVAVCAGLWVGTSYADRRTRALVRELRKEVERGKTLNALAGGDNSKMLVFKTLSGCPAGCGTHHTCKTRQCQGDCGRETHHMHVTCENCKYERIVDPTVP